MKRVILSGGGTGGHIYPAITIAKEIAKLEETEFLFVGTPNGMESRIIPKEGYRFASLPASGLKRKLTLENIGILCRTAGSLFKARRILKDFAPDVVIGHLDGEVDLARWRGRTTWGSPEQVAVHSVMRDEGVALADVAAVTSAALDGSTWEVEVAAADRTYRRTVARTFSEPRRLTCGLDLKVMAQWSVVGGSR